MSASEVSETGIHPPSYWPIPLDVTYIHNSNGNAWRPTGANIQKAIDDLPTVTGANPSTHAGQVWIPPAPRNNPLLVDQISIHGNLHFIGSGIGATWIQLNDNQNKSMFKWAKSSDEYGFMMSNLACLGNKGNQSAGHILEVDDSNGGDLDDVILHHVAFVNAKQDGINSDCAWGWYLDDFRVEYCDQYGINFNKGSGATLEGCKIALNSQHGIVSSCQNLRLVGGEISYNGGKGIQQTATYLQVIGGFYNANGKSAANTFDAIHLGASADHSVITSPTIYGHQAGTDYTRHGVNIASGCTDVKIRDLRALSITGNPVNDSGTRTVVDGVGNNGTNDPASAGDWNGNGYEGVLVKWDAAGPTHHMSVYRNGAWYDWTVT